MTPAKSAATPLRVWPAVATFLGWGIGLSFLQWGAEQSAALSWMTERLAWVLVHGLGGLAHVPAEVDGTVVKLHGVAQEVTPHCLGLAAITFLVAAVLATPAGWRERLRGVGLGLAAIVLANVVRLVVLGWFFVYAMSAFGFVHIPIWGTIVPLFLVGVWGFWLVRDLHALPAFPLKLVGRVALWLPPLLAGWYLALDTYVVTLVLGINAALTALGVPIETVRLTGADLFRHLDVTLAGGGFRLEVAAQTLNVIPYLALTLASPLALGRRVLLACYGLAALVALHVTGTAAIVVLAWIAPLVVAPFQVVNDFVSLAAGPALWLLLTRPSRAWFSGPAQGVRRRARLSTAGT